MLNANQIQAYPDWEPPALTQRLAAVVTQIVSLTEEWWRMQGDETRTKAEAFIASTGDSIAAKTRDVELATYHVTSSILETRAQLEALKEERNFLILLIQGVRSSR